MRKSWTEGPHGWLDKPSHCRQISNEFMSICRSQRQKGVKHKLLPLLYFDGWLSCMREHFAIDLYSWCLTCIFDIVVVVVVVVGCLRNASRIYWCQLWENSSNINSNALTLFLSPFFRASVSFTRTVCSCRYMYLTVCLFAAFFLSLYLLIISINKDLS